MKLKTYSSAGFTITEMMVALAIMSFVIVALVSYFSVTRKTFTSFEVTTQLKTYNQKAINKINIRLSECKRLFQNTANDLAYASRLNFTGYPAVMSGARLPVIEPSGSLSPGAVNFYAASAGNILFFAESESTKVLENISNGTSTSTVRVDAYIFNVYYLTSAGAKTFYNRPGFRLIEWHSQKYADYDQITNITNATKKSNTIIALVNAGVSFSWQPSATNVSAAFYNLTSGGAITVNPGHLVSGASYQDMVVFPTGISGGTFRYGISPNTGDIVVTTQAVPKFAQVLGQFPGGFEVLIVGPSSSRRIFLRTVLIAQGSMGGLLANEATLLCTTRDSW